MSHFSTARKNMVDCQIHTSGVNVPAILQAFETIPREAFVPKAAQNVAYMDYEAPLGEGRFILEPAVHAKMVQALDPKATDVVLDIGGATGYSAAIFSSLVTTVIAVEDKKKYVDQAKKIWADIGISNVVALQNALTKGNPENAPFDLIFMNGAVAEIPESLVAQLAPEGRLITIVKPRGEAMGRVTLVRAFGERQFSSYTLFEAGAPYLPGFEPQSAFIF